MRNAIIILSFILIPQAVTAQLLIDPSHTVNITTGEMKFSLPLGTVQGMNGADFPINLDYGAGIKVQQAASPAGLGFAYGPGGISRKVVYVADNNYGGNGKFKQVMGKFYSEDLCEKPWWLVLAAIFLGAFFLSLAFMPMVDPLTGIGLALLGAVTFNSLVTVMTSVVFNSSDYIAGGSHVPGYNKDGNGQGFFRGATDDLPDIYFVNTPFISGELVWSGPADTAQGGKFVLKGSATTKITYTLDAETFEIVLADGTKLIFDKIQKSSSYSHIYWQANPTEHVSCDADGYTQNIERVAHQWFLTKVLYPDYVDNDNDGVPSNPDRGAWVKFDYETIGPIPARPLPEAFQLDRHSTIIITAGSDPVAAGSCILEEHYLKFVRTPNQSAEFIYTSDRKDDLWFHENSYNWVTEARGHDPAAKRITRKMSGGTPVGPGVVERKVLERVIFRNKDGANLRTVKLTTDYSLRPGSMHSFDKDGAGDFIGIGGNTTGGCLTLKKVTIVSNNGDEIPVAQFYYGFNPAGWDRTLIGDPPGSGENKMEFYTEERDIWGYYMPRLPGKTTNNFNSEGDEARTWNAANNTTNAAAWSVNRVVFGTGSKIRWNYESNRYCYTNGERTTAPDASGEAVNVTRFGGGIRVKQVLCTDLVNGKKDYTTNYFYRTDDPAKYLKLGANEPQDSSSGYTVAEPFDNLNEIDIRHPKARGGYYTPVKVTYRKVAVAGYLDASTALNGYSIYEFTHAGESTASGYQPNGGDYGETDYNWKRGLLIKSSTYNNNHKLISQEIPEYEYYKQGSSSLPVLSTKLLYLLQQNTTGLVKLKKTTKTQNDLNICNQLLFADDLTTAAVDTYESRKEFQLFDANKSIPPSNVSFSMKNHHRVMVCKKTDASDASKEKIAIIRTEYSKAIIICLGENVNKDYTTHSSTEKWSNWEYYYDMSENIPFHIIGAQFFKMDENDYDDLIVVLTDNHKESCLNFCPYLYVYVFHDIQIDKDKQLQFRDHEGYTKSASCTWLDRKEGSDDEYNCPVGCMIGNFHGNPEKPDFLLLTNSYDIEAFPGDLIPEQNRSIYAIMDFREGPTAKYVYTPEVYRSGTDYPYYGTFSFFTALDQDNVNNDLIITGPGLTTNLWQEKQPRAIAYQRFKNVSFNDADKSIIIPEDCENCGSGSELFKVKPSFSWDKFTLGGVFNDDATDHQQFIFPEWSNDGFHFNIFDYLHIPFLGDYDGAPNRSYTRTIDDTILLSASIPAYSQTPYKEMGDPRTDDNKHMLTQQCGSVTYNFSGTTTESVLKGDLSGQTDRVVAANASTWSKVNGTWLPCANYAWKIPMNRSGLPVKSYVPFNYTLPTSSDESWKLTDSICKYTSNHFPKETATPTSSNDRLISSIVYGHKGSIITGKISNARFDECGVYTCDYDLNETATNDGSLCFDLENGWKKGGAVTGFPDLSVTEIKAEAKHFGEKGLKVTNSFGAVRVFKLERDKDYVFSAWVKPILVAASNPATVPFEEGKIMNVTYRTSVDNGATWPLRVNPNIPSTPEIGSSGKLNYKQYGDWYYIELSVPASKDLKKDWENGYQYAVAWVGCPGGNGAGQSATVYVDDIRFNPKGALVSSTYYDQKWYQPVLSIDANSKPGQRVTYDDFGRPYLFEKLDLTKATTHAAYATKVMEKEYHLRNELKAGQNIQLLFPDFGGVFNVYDEIDIGWVNRNNVIVTISFENYNTTPPVIKIVHSAMFQAGYNEWKWRIPLEACGENKIRVEVNSEYDQSDEKFTVKNPNPRGVINAFIRKYVFRLINSF